MKLNMHNPNCDGSSCVSDDGEVRVLPTSSQSNAILCRICYGREMLWRQDRNRVVATPFDLPQWEDLKVYAP